MSYFASLDIPANTTLNNPLRYDLKVSPCMLERISILFPSGCVGLVGIWFEYLSSRIYPTNDNEVITGDGVLWDVRFDKDLIRSPYELAIYGYNLDDTYSHKPLILLDVKFYTVSALREVLSGDELLSALNQINIGNNVYGG